LFFFSGFRFQVSAQPLAAEAANLIEDETSLELEKSRKELWERLPAAMNSIWRIPESWLEATPTRQ
jgi:hypothetical protein